MTGYTICTTAPAEEPVTLNEAKLHLRLDTSPISAHPDDSLITALIKTARRWCEGFQGRVYVTQSWDLYLDAFPDGDYIEIPMPPLQSIVSLSYKDSAGVTQTVSFVDPSGTVLTETDDYRISSFRQPGRIYLRSEKSWPTTLDESDAVWISFVSGYGLAADVPDEVKTAILLKLSDLYENRGDQEAPARYEMAAEALF